MSTIEETQRLTTQLRAVLLNKPVLPEMKTQAEDLQELQSAVEYISVCLKETQDFLSDLCAGRLNASPPGRHNFIAGGLKELHSILKHLTWQTAQVANGDYSQKVSFLGEFSDSFNIMTSQLRERELSILTKTNALDKSMSLLKAVLDVQQDWVVVIDVEQHKPIYSNLSAKRKFFNPDTRKATCSDYELLLNQLLEEDGDERSEKEYICEDRNNVFLIKSFPIDWDDSRAFVHCISDVTDEHEEKEQLQDLAYKDTLTGAYNRRYCIQKSEKLVERFTPFSIVMIDLDGLKSVNDIQGHLQGDDYIISVAQSITMFSRNEDKLCRIGGDEFVLLMPDCIKENAEKKMKRICEHLSSLEKPYEAAISYGIVFVDSSSETNFSTAEELFSLADEKMYAMKQDHKQEKV